jgi:hypothetical protein
MQKLSDWLQNKLSILIATAISFALGVALPAFASLFESKLLGILPPSQLLRLAAALLGLSIGLLAYFAVLWYRDLHPKKKYDEVIYEGIVFRRYLASPSAGWSPFCPKCQCPISYDIFVVNILTCPAKCGWALDWKTTKDLGDMVWDLDSKHKHPQ